MIPLPAGCDEAATVEEVERAADGVVDAFAAWDTPGMVAGHAASIGRVGCLADVVTPVAAAKLHLAYGIAEWKATRQIDPAARAFAAAARSDPNMGIPDHAVPEMDDEHPLRVAWASAPTDATVETFDVPDRLVARVDGVRSSERVAGQPALIQLIDAEHRVRWSRYVVGPVVFDGAPPPSELSPILLRDPGTWTAQHFRRSTGPLLVTSVLLGVGAAGLNGYAASREASFNDRSLVRSEEQLAALRQQVNTASLASGITAGAAGLAALGGLVTVRW